MISENIRNEVYERGFRDLWDLLDFKKTTAQDMAYIRSHIRKQLPKCMEDVPIYFMTNLSLKDLFYDIVDALKEKEKRGCTVPQNLSGKKGLWFWFDDWEFSYCLNYGGHECLSFNLIKDAREHVNFRGEPFTSFNYHAMCGAYKLGPYWFLCQDNLRNREYLQQFLRDLGLQNSELSTILDED